jgi:threonine dehydrogenase-like Zn-dependent dehydrogenase
MEGVWRNGTWAEKVLVPLENVTVLDEKVLLEKMGYSIPHLCWINALLVPYGGWRAAGLCVGDVAIVAPATGYFGGAAVRVALALGARLVVAAGRNEKMLEKLLEMDTTGRIRTVVLTGDADTDTNALKTASGGKGADIYIDFSPPQAANATHPQACISALKAGGQAILMGGVRENISFNYAQLMLNNIILRGNFMYGADAPAKVAGLVESGALSLEELESTTFGFEQLGDAIQYAQTHAGFGKQTVLQVA